MKKIIFVLMFGIFLVFLLQALIVSAPATSADYSADYYTGISGGDGSSSEFDSEFAFMYQGTGSAENSNYSVNIGIFPQPLFCGDGICNNNENCDTCSVDCGCASGYTCSSGVCVVVTPTPSGGSGGTSCTYDWVCSEWYPEPCPTDGIQKRVCVNRGTCGGTIRMPSTIRTCTPGIILPKEPLFDLFVNVPLQYKWIIPGQAVGFDVKLINVGNTTTIDVFFKYWIVDKNGRLIAETQETRAIGEKEEFRIRILLPEGLEEGIYKIYVQIDYDSGKVAIAEDSFEIVISEFDIIFKKLTFLSYILIPIILIILILVLLLRKRRKKKIRIVHKEPKKKSRRIGFFKRMGKSFREHRRRKRIREAFEERRKEAKRQYLLRRKRQKRYAKIREAKRKEAEKRKKEQYAERLKAEKRTKRKRKVRSIFSIFKGKKKIKHEKPRKKKVKHKRKKITGYRGSTINSLINPEKKQQRYEVEEKIRKNRLRELRKRFR